MTGPLRNLTIAGLLAAILSLSFAGIAGADPAAEIKFRQSNMKAIGGHMGALAAMVKGARAPVRPWKYAPMPMPSAGCRALPVNCFPTAPAPARPPPSQKSDPSPTTSRK